MTASSSGQASNALREVMHPRARSLAYMRTASLVSDVTAVALQAVGYRSMLPALIPPLPRGSHVGSVPASQRMQITQLFRRWLDRGERLPMRYHLLWPMPSGDTDKLGVDVGAHCALLSENDVSRQLAADSLAVECIVNALQLPFAGSALLTVDSTETAMTRGFYIAGPDGSHVPFATSTHEQPCVLNRPEPAREPIHQTSLRIALTMLADLVLDFYPELEAEPQ